MQLIMFSIQQTHPSSLHIRRAFSTSPRRSVSSAGNPLWSTELRIELGPALQLAHELPIELRRAPKDLRRTL
jgi:hypothetical protein